MGLIAMTDNYSIVRYPLIKSDVQKFGQWIDAFGGFPNAAIWFMLFI
jgi:hypothetical protein